MYAIAFHYVRDRAEARDLTQDAFIRVYRKIGSYKGDGFLPWLLRLVRNLCVDHLRRRKARPPAADVPIERSARLILDANPGPEEAWLTDTRKRLVYDALRRMTGPSREMILLKEIEGLKLREIADLLLVPVGTVKSRSSRARIDMSAARLFSRARAGGVRSPAVSSA